MIPQEKLEAVSRAMREAFGTDTIDEVHILTKGQSGALVYRIVVQGSPFLLRLITRTNDPTLPQHFACMKLAAEAGIAPRVLHTSREDRLSITDFIRTLPFSRQEARVRMPAVLRALHALPPFPVRADHLNTTCTFLLNQNAAAEALLQRVQAANILPGQQGKDLFHRYEQIAAAYSTQESDWVSSHNDLFKPDNILFDGRRVWLVDWEAAFRNDRYADLAALANMVVFSEEQEREFLQDYLGAPPDEDQSARFFLVRQVAHLFYAIGFLYLGSLDASIDWSEPVQEFQNLNRRLWDGEFRLTDAASKITYGRAHLQQFLTNTSRAQFSAALETVLRQNRKASPGLSAGV